MTVLLVSAVGPTERWIELLNKAMPGEVVRADPDAPDLDDVDVALVAHARAGVYRRLPGLRLIIALQAGVDSLLADPDLPPGIPIARAGRADGDRMITEYALLHVLRHHRYMPEYVAQQGRAEWVKRDVRVAAERRVGFMGLGLIGLAAARLVRDIGFQVAAWTRVPHTEPGIESFHGPDRLAAFLGRSEIVVNLLPLTADTDNILCADTLAMLPEGAALINLGRGQHVVDDDLIAALDSGRLSAATLDVFRTEPLPADDRFWRHPKITLMPHTARASRPANAVPQVAENVRRLRAGEALLNPVDRDAGY